MNNLENKLNKFTVPQSGSGKSMAVKAAAAALKTAELNKCSSKDFLFAQIRFIQKKMWLLQLALFAGICLLITLLANNGAELNEILPFFSAAAPLIILINISDFARFYNTGMLELEMAAKYGLQKAAAAKLIIFGISDGLILLAASAFCAQAAKTSLIFMLLYCIVPFNCMCAGCIVLLERAQAEHFKTAGAMLALMLSGIIFIANMQENIYTHELNGLWLSAFFVSLVAAALQVHRLLKQLSTANNLLLKHERKTHGA